METKPETIHCPACGSTNWRCWDERDEFFQAADGEILELPVGYLVCRDCGHDWVDRRWDGCTYLGADEQEAFGYA